MQIYVLSIDDAPQIQNDISFQKLLEFKIFCPTLLYRLVARNIPKNFCSIDRQATLNLVARRNLVHFPVQNAILLLIIQLIVSRLMS